MAHRGGTLEYALVVAADAYLAWGDLQTATHVLRRAALAGGRRPRISLKYVESMENRANELLAGGDAVTANSYLEIVALMVTDVFHSEPSVVSRVSEALSRARGSPAS